MTDSVSEAAGGLPKKRRALTNAATPVDRLPPNAPEAEQGALGCVLIADDPPAALDNLLEILKTADAFYDLRHQTVYHALVEMRGKKEPIDIITLQQRIKDRGLLDEIGGIPYLNVLQDSVPSAANIAYYCDIVAEKHLLRRWLAICASITTRIYDFEGDVDQLTDEISRDLFKLCEARTRSTDRPMTDVIADVHEKYISKFRRGVKHKIGPMTGFNYVDNILPGLGGGQLIVLAARPRTGKSAWMMQVAEHIALAEKIPVAVFSLEMTAVSLGARAVFQRAGADMTKFLNGFMEKPDVEKIMAASTELSVDNMRIDEAASLSIEDLEIRARRMVARHGIGVFFVDYFQLLFVRARQRNWNTNDELGHVSRRLKALAKELNVPIVVCAQMNREIEKETHRRPRLSDLRDTGQLEQDADVIGFLWKPDVSTDRAKKRVQQILPRLQMVPADWRLEAAWKKNLAIVTLTIEKQREGRSGEDATLVFIKPWTRFVDAYNPVTAQAALPETPAAAEPEPPNPETDEEGDE